VLGGIAAIAVTWIVLLSIKMWQVYRVSRRQQLIGFGAMAGGWNFLLRTPFVVVILIVAFVVGFYLGVR